VHVNSNSHVVFVPRVQPAAVLFLLRLKLLAAPRLAQRPLGAPPLAGITPGSPVTWCSQWLSLYRSYGTVSQAFEALLQMGTALIKKRGTGILSLKSHIVK